MQSMRASSSLGSLGRLNRSASYYQPKMGGDMDGSTVSSRFLARKQERASTASLSLTASQSSALFAAPSPMPSSPGSSSYKWRALPSLPNAGAREKQQLLRQQSRERFEKVAEWMAKTDQAKAAAAAAAAQSRPTTTAEPQRWGPPKKGTSKGPQASATVMMTQQQPVYEEPEVDHAAIQKKAIDRQKLKGSSFVQSAGNALNSRFSDMFKAFQYVDLDRSGTLNKKEIARALDLWNIPIDHEKLDDLIAACDEDGNGEVDYKEFVDVLARDTVAGAAMGKRGMNSQEAMGVADVDPEFLGHKKVKNVRASINANLFDDNPPPTPQVAAAPQAKAAAAPTRAPVSKANLKQSSFVQSASSALNSRFSDMFKAFQYVDMDRSGTLNKKEIARALDLWNIPIDHEKLDDLIAACDEDGNGEVDYKEFVDVLARDTVAGAAMGKRGMNSQEAMGVADVDPEFLGHKKVKNVRASINANLFDDDPPRKAAPAPKPAAAPGGFGANDTGVVNSYAQGGGGQVMINDNFAHATPAQKRIAPAVMQHDLGAKDQMPATQAELKSYIKQLRERVEMKYKQMRKAFQQADKDSSGMLDPEEIVTMVQNFALPFPLSHIDEIFQGMDADGNGQVSYSEFAKIMQQDEDLWIKTEERMKREAMAKAPPAASKSATKLRNEVAEAAAAPPAPPAPKAVDKTKLKQSSFVQSASSALNSRFSDMFKAFQYVDMDRSGTLNKKEIARALDLWNIPIDHEKLDDLIAACDEDGNGEVDYKEFVDVLARDTVAGAAMGKRGMNSQEAMGVADVDPEFLGHKKVKNIKASLNDLTFD